MRFYQFKVDEIVDDAYPDLDLEIDPKLSWALRHPEKFPIDINRADYELILRVPGIGVKSAKLIIASRRYSKLGYYQLEKNRSSNEESTVFHHVQRAPDENCQRNDSTGCTQLATSEA